MTTKLSERVVNWSADGSSVVQFRYEIDHLKFVFNVRPGTVRDVLRDIGRLAADDSSPMTWDDAAYLTALIRDVMEMLHPTPVESDDASIYVGNDLYVIGWTIMMMVCSATFCVALFVFFVWGW